jgi:hypothetical protein
LSALLSCFFKKNEITKADEKGGDIKASIITLLGDEAAHLYARKKA